MNGSSDRREFLIQVAGRVAAFGLVSAGAMRPLAGDEKKNQEKKDANVDG